jgi:hypothetical protein
VEFINGGSKDSSRQGDQGHSSFFFLLFFFFFDFFFYFFLFSDGGLPSGLPHCVCPFQPLALLGRFVACLHAMAGLNVIKLNSDL